MTVAAVRERLGAAFEVKPSRTRPREYPTRVAPRLLNVSDRIEADRERAGGFMSDTRIIAMSEQPNPTGAPVTATTRKRGGRTAAVAVILLLVAVGVGVAWVSYTRSPTYSLGMMANAARSKDWDGVQKYVDVDAVVGHAVDAALGQGLKSTTSGFGGLVAGLAQSTKPALSQLAKASFKNSIESGQVSLGGLVGVASIFVGQRVKSVTFTGNEALVTVEVPQDAVAPFDLKLRMKRVDDFWRVTAIENILELPNTPLK